MASEGENAANWIIGKITAYAKATKEPFSERELHFLRLSIMDFDLKDQEEFLAVNAKTVRILRDTITDEKLAGAQCVEARPGLYIPPDWRENYLKVYDSELPWLVSHCAQSAMLSEPTLGESTWWQSPRVTNGFRPSVVGQLETNSMDTESADQEFDALISKVQGFITVGGLVKVFISMIQKAVGQPAIDEDFEAWSCAEAVLIAFSLSDLDDDVTSSFAHLIVDKEILSKDVNQRESLSSKTIPGANLVFSKEKVMTWEVAQNFSLQKPTAVLTMAFTFDRFCEGLGIAPVAVKLYAIKASHLAAAVVTSSVFSSQQGKNMGSAFSYGSFLKACIDVAETPGLNSKSDDQILSEIQNLLKTNSDVKDLVHVLDLNNRFFASLKDWQEDFQARCLEVAQSRLAIDDENNDEYSHLEEDHEYSGLEEDQEYSDLEEGTDTETKSGVRSAAMRLRELNELWHEGEITLEEFNAKRNQIINEI